MWKLLFFVVASLPFCARRTSRDRKAHVLLATISDVHFIMYSRHISLWQPTISMLSLSPSFSVYLYLTQSHKHIHLVVSWFRSVLRRNHICVQKAAATSLWWKKVCETLLRWVELVTNFGRMREALSVKSQGVKHISHLSINLCLSKKNQHTPTSRVDP